jgi:predicted RNA-binding Zn ribbon-like protein
MADPEFLLLGDALWLEFVNTARPGADTLPDAASFLRWRRAVQVDHGRGAESFPQVRKFRDQLVALAAALEARRIPPASVIESINSRIAGLEGREQLVRIGGAWRMRFAPGRSPQALEAIAHSVAVTLATPPAAIRLCANRGCGLYLLDDSPNQSRRWCSRARCGQGTRIERRRNARLTPVVSEG